MLQEILKKATAADHKKLESLMYVNNLVEGTLTLPEYRHLIYTNFLVHRAAEQSIFALLQPGTKAALGTAKRGKLAALEKDVAALGFDLFSVPDELPAFEINNEAAALGAMYVMEGATLGGQVILKMLQKNKAFKDLSAALNYYNVYGTDLGANWKTFCAVINALPTEAVDDAVAGSKIMYAYFEKLHAITAPIWLKDFC